MPRAGKAATLVKDICQKSRDKRANGEIILLNSAPAAAVRSLAFNNSRIPQVSFSKLSLVSGE
jgi:hypothetical protein